MKIILLLLIAAVAVRHSAADTKRCFCKAVDAFNMGRVLKDLHVVETHRHWLHVGCNRLNGCWRICDRIVQQWVCKRTTECKAAAGNALVRSQFQASVCEGGNGHTVMKCGACAPVKGPRAKAAKSATKIGPQAEAVKPTKLGSIARMPKESLRRMKAFKELER